MNVRFHQLAYLALVLASTFGCGSADALVEENQNLLNPVKGAITLNGKDIPTGAIVTFHAKDGGPTAPKISGTYSADESYFSVSTLKDGTSFGGAPEGVYTVTIHPPRKKPGSIPAKYGSPATSGLTVEIKQGMNNLPEIKLAS
jgi:hypothetical protein